MKTYMAKPSEIERKWWLVDAEGKVLGRLAAELSTILQGKHKPTYTPHIDTGDFVVVINADKIRLTGKKRRQKQYKRYSGYPGGLKIIPFEQMIERRPTEALRLAVKRMLPKSRLGRRFLKKLKLFAGTDHPHEAQNPEPREI